MGIIALLISLTIVGLVIAGFIAYWIVMIGLIIFGVVFLFWVYLFTYYFDGQFIVVPCAVIATGLTVWAFIVYIDKSDKKKASRDS